MESAQQPALVEEESAGKHLPRHLHEFAYRFNARWRDRQLGQLILAHALASPPLPY